MLAGERPLIDSKKVPRDMQELIKTCWAGNASKRPEFWEIGESLRKIQENQPTRRPTLAANAASVTYQAPVAVNSLSDGKPQFELTTVMQPERLHDNYDDSSLYADDDDTGNVASVNSETQFAPSISAKTELLSVWKSIKPRQMAIEDHADKVTSVAFSLDGAKVVIGTLDNVVFVRGAHNGAVLSSLEGHTKPVRSVSFSHDGTLLASCSFDKTVRVWNVTTGKCLNTLVGPANFPSVSFSPDGLQLLTGSWDNMARVWDVKSGKCLHTLEGHRDGVTSVAFCSDFLASGSEDTSVRLWNARDCGFLFVLNEHTTSC